MSIILIQEIILFLVTANAILSIINCFVVARYQKELKLEKERGKKLIKYIQDNKKQY